MTYLLEFNDLKDFLKHTGTSFLQFISSKLLRYICEMFMAGCDGCNTMLHGPLATLFTDLFFSVCACHIVGRISDMTSRMLGMGHVLFQVALLAVSQST